MINDDPSTDTITLTPPGPGTGYSSSDIGTITSIDLSSLNVNNLASISLTPTAGTSYTLGTGLGLGATGANAVWTTTTTGTGVGSAVGGIWPGNITAGQSGKISLKGPGADVDIDGKSLKAWMEKVEERLNILTPNPELEKDWDDLRKLGERYRKLEQRCKEKAEVWKKLKSMPPPKPD